MIIFSSTIMEFFNFLFTVCMHNGMAYEEGAQIQPNCSVRCTCRSGNFQCKQQNCIFDGQSTCYAYTDPHYYTYDRRYYQFQGSCEYILTKSCNSSEFSVIVSNDAHNSRVSCTESVRVLVPNENLDILLGRGGGGTVTINDILQPNNGDEVILRSGQVNVLRVGGRPRVILYRSGVIVSWNGLYRVAVTVSGIWRGQLCGLCGNFNDDPNDDFLSPTGTLEASVNTFALSWMVNSQNDGVCGELIDVGTCTEDLMREARTRCNRLTRDPFDRCNDILDPITFIDSCTFDYCYSDESVRENFYDNMLATYAAACADDRVVLPPTWRNEIGWLYICAI